MVSKIFGTLLCVMGLLVIVAELFTAYEASQSIVKVLAVSSAICSGYLFAKDGPK